jgi:hypothetical protein
MAMNLEQSMKQGTGETEVLRENLKLLSTTNHT